jgi:hypothetical protein
MGVLLEVAARVAVWVGVGVGTEGSVARMVALAGRVGAGVGFGPQLESTRLAMIIKLGILEKINDFFISTLPVAEENIDIFNKFFVSPWSRPVSAWRFPGTPGSLNRAHPAGNRWSAGIP